ncbi:glycosyl hydrolase family 28-related protein [Paenibacillus hodogayensis]|uniref:Glycosyl hydrolase family 28-related protein n=1 Tax=Paenibacillus hodogayensis TaxID=279208 RepID=A0ABV5VZN4_9BACL
MNEQETQEMTERNRGMQVEISRRKLLASLGIAGLAATAGGWSLASAGSNTVTYATYSNGEGDPEGCAAQIGITTIAELKALSSGPCTSVFFVKDSLREGVFVWDTADTASADNGGTVVVDAFGRRWKRVVDDVLKVQWFGAKGDGLADDTDAIQACINAASPGQTVYFPKGTYIVLPSGITRYIQLRSNLTLLGEGASSVIKVKDNAGNYGTVMGGPIEPYFCGGMVQNLTIRSLKFDHNFANNNGAVIQTANTTRSHILTFFNFKNITVESCIFDPVSSRNALNFNSSKSSQVTVRNNYFQFAKRTGDVYYDNTVVYCECSDYRIQDNHFSATDASVGFATGAIELHGSPCVASGNLIHRYIAGIQLCSAWDSYNDFGNFVVANNTFNDVYNGIYLHMSNMPLKNVLIDSNVIAMDQLAYYSFSDGTTAGIRIIDVIQTPGRTIEKLSITNNQILFKPETTGSSTRRVYGTGGILLDYPNGIDGVIVEGNQIVNSPAAGISIQKSSAATTISKNISIRNNHIINSGQNVLATSIVKAAIMAKRLENVVIENNIIRDDWDTMRGYYAFSMEPGAYFKDVTVRNNQITAKQGGYRLDYVDSKIDYLPPIAFKFSAVYPPVSGDYTAGDMVWNTGAVTPGTSVAGYKVIESGTAGTLTGVTASIAFNTSVMTVSDSSSLKVGNVVSVAGLTDAFTILHITGTAVTVKPRAGGTATGAALSFRAPALREFGLIG